MVRHALLFPFASYVTSEVHLTSLCLHFLINKIKVGTRQSLLKLFIIPTFTTFLKGLDKPVKCKIHFSFKILHFHDSMWLRYVLCKGD